VSGHAFVGWCYTSDPAVTPPALPASNNLVIEARDQSATLVPGKLYVREKKAGVWGAWTSNAFGAASITDTNATLSLIKTGSGGVSAVTGAVIPNTPRWAMYLGNSTPEGGGNGGSDFQIDRFSDAGALLGTPFAIGRATGAASFAQTLAIGNVGTTGSLYFGNTGAKSLTYDGANFAFAGGPLLVYPAAITAGYGGATGTYYFGNSGSAYLTYGGGNFILNGGPCVVNNYVMSVVSATTGTYYFGNSGTKYLTFDNVNFIFSGAPLVVGASINSAVAANSGTYGFGTGGTKYLTFDGSKFIFAGGNVWHGSPAASVDAPVATGTSVSGVWPVGVSSVDRGILFLSTSASNLYAYFTQSTISNSVGSIGGSTTTTSYNTASSGELKEDLKSFDAGNIIDATNVYDFAWKKTGERSYGVIAQQAIDIYPMAVTHMQVKEAEGGEFWGVDYSKYVPVLLQELKALRARVAALEGK
jgi:hypothetical protein